MDTLYLHINILSFFFYCIYVYVFTIYFIWYNFLSLLCTILYWHDEKAVSTFIVHSLWQ